LPVSNGTEAGALVTTVKSFVVDALACVVQLLQQALKIFAMALPINSFFFTEK
jgi:hypothetical protein